MKAFNILSIGCLSLILLTTSTHAQTAATASYNVGDTVHSINFKRLLNYKSKEANLIDFKGKVVILDFWNTHCGSCIASFPKMQDLQKKFGEKLQILLINNYDSEEKIIKFLEKRKTVFKQPIHLPIAYGDSTIKRYFPHTSVPHYVVIDRNGVVKSIPRVDQLTNYNIQSFIEGKTLQLPSKIERRDLIVADITKPFLLDSQLGIERDEALHSTLSKVNRKDILPGFGTMSISSVNLYSIYIINYPIEHLYKLAYYDDIYPNTLLPSSRVIVDIKDTVKYKELLNWEPYDYTGYIYQVLTNKESSLSELQKVMQQDLRQYFGLHARMEKRKVNCLILSASDTNMIKCKEPSNKRIMITNDGAFRFKNVEASFIRTHLQYVEPYYYSDKKAPPIIDETGFSGLVDICLEGVDVRNYKALAKAFKAYKMDFKLEPREIDVLVISDRD